MNNYSKLDSEKIKTNLSEFFNTHSDVSLSEENNKVILKKIWGDDSISIDISKKTSEIIPALNGLIFPTQFTAIYHKKIKALEIIYSPLAKPEELNRKFSVSFNDKIYECGFFSPSETLYLIADTFEPSGPATNTDYRNLMVFKRYLENRDKKHSLWSTEAYVPASFWIKNFEWQDTLAVSLAKHLNFYMYYFDRTTPRILIHETQIESAVKNVEKPFDKFPENINIRFLDPYLLGLWESASQARDVFRRYLYYYQMLEYSAFYYIQDNVYCRLEQILSSPESSAYPAVAAHRILEAITTDKMSDESKIEAIINEAVNVDLLWKEIEINKNHFSENVIFDGGFELKSILNKDTKKEDFITNCKKSLPLSFRRIRNALVHAREARMADVIAPSRKNYNKISPWVAPLGLVAMQVACYIGNNKPEKSRS